jgi:hypothetical protein
MFPPGSRVERAGSSHLSRCAHELISLTASALRYEPDRHHNASDREGVLSSKVLSSIQRTVFELSVGKDAIVVS